MNYRQRELNLPTRSAIRLGQALTSNNRGNTGEILKYTETYMDAPKILGRP